MTSETASLLIEVRAAEAVINHLGWQLENPLEFAPKPNLTPDVLAVTKNRCCVGVEVTVPCDQDYIEHMEAVKKGKEAVARDPRSWSSAGIQDEIRALLVDKDQKRRKALLGGDSTWCESWTNTLSWSTLTNV